VHSILGDPLDSQKGGRKKRYKKASHTLAYLKSSSRESQFNNYVSRTDITKGQPATTQHELGRGTFSSFQQSSEFRIFKFGFEIVNMIKLVKYG